MGYRIRTTAAVAVLLASVTPGFAKWNIDTGENVNGRPIVFAENFQGPGGFVLACGAGFMHVEADLPAKVRDNDNIKVSFQVDGNAPHELRGFTGDSYFFSLGNNDRPTKGVQNLIADMVRGKTVTITAVGRTAVKASWSLKGFGKAYNSVKANCP
ncbi:MAG: hypothetical protein AAGA08_20640 [Pseudomonadota bacterium]